MHQNLAFLIKGHHGKKKHSWMKDWENIFEMPKNYRNQ